MNKLPIALWMLLFIPSVDACMWMESHWSQIGRMNIAEGLAVLGWYVAGMLILWPYSSPAAKENNVR